MAGASFSVQAKADLLAIAAYTLRTWGEPQAMRYLDKLESCAGALARNPGPGRKCEWIRPELMRLECGRDVLFYRRKHSGIVVTRVLHRSMLPVGRFPEDENSES